VGGGGGGGTLTLQTKADYDCYNYQDLSTYKVLEHASFGRSLSYFESLLNEL